MISLVVIIVFKYHFPFESPTARLLEPYWNQVSIDDVDQLLG